MPATVKILEQAAGLAPIVPAEAPVAKKNGYMKARITYLTNEPKHIRSFQLAVSYGFHGPFSEEVYVLVPQKDIKPGFDFRKTFEYLQLHGVIVTSAKYRKFDLCDEDNYTLAYAVK